MLSYQNRMIDIEPVHEYFDVQAVHQNNDNTDVPLKFNENRTVAYLRDPSKYFMSVVRFNLSTNLPVFIPRIQTGQPDPNITIYTMYVHTKIGTADYSFKQTFAWETQSNAPAPTSTVIQSLETNYYYCYSYQYFLSLMNAQLANKLSLINGLSKLWFELDRSTYNIKLNFIASDITCNPRFFVNAPLANLLATMPMQSLQASNNPYPSIINKPVSEIMWQNIDNQTLSTTTPVTVSTDASPLPNWNQISSVVFTSNNLPVVPSLTSTPKVYGNNTGFGSVSSGNNTTAIITDFTVSVGPNSLYVPVIDYLPQAEYRLNDMEGNKELTNLDIEVYWKDKYGNLYPLLIPSGGVANLKILFRKKIFNNIR